jgi:FkbM family methyltransferase
VESGGRKQFAGGHGHGPPAELSVLGRRVKHGLKWLLAPVSARIRGGPLAGMHWAIVTGSRFVSGTYEQFKTEAIVEVLKPGDAVVDVGAHVGYYTALASKLVGPTGTVIAFEPRPLNLRFLRQHVEANRLDNVRVVEAGVGDRRGPAAFDSRTGTGTGHLADDGDLIVDAVRLDDLYRDREIPRANFLKIDVEGGELGVLRGALELVRAERPVILVATHGEELHRQVVRLLADLDYDHEVLDTGGRSGDTEVLATPRQEPSIPTAERAPEIP